MKGRGPGKPRTRWRPRLRTVLLAVHLLILALPLAGISLLRLYDSLLIRQTESELIVQGAVVASLYRQQLLVELAAGGADPKAYGRVLVAPQVPDPDNPFDPAIPGLDLARHEVLPATPDATEPVADAGPLAAAAGGRVAPVLKEAKLVSLAALRVVDPNGVVVASSGDGAGLGLHHRTEVAAALDGLKVSVLRRRDVDDTPPLGSISRGTKLRVAVAVPVVRGDRVWGAVVLERTPLSVRQAVYRDRRYFVGGGAALLVAVAFLTWLTTRTLVRPLRDLIAQTERVRRGERGAAVPLEHPGTHEVDRISRSVADMATALEQRADYIATFAANVSHELKTPLTSIRGAVELLRDHMDEMTPGELQRFLGILEKDGARLERLVGRLLELARADVVRPGVDSAPVSRILEAIAERFAAGGLDVKATSDRPLEASMAADVLDSVVSALVENARQNGGEGVRVRLTAGAAGDRVEIRIADDGPGISEANLPRIFDRFFTTRRSEGGTGLGLAIARALAEAHGGTLEVASRPGDTVFVLSLPTP
ncbi:MAG: HAMP domain-containing sensor histidine kinase [Acidobacteriota bacterium]